MTDPEPRTVTVKLALLWDCLFTLGFLTLLGGALLLSLGVALMILGMGVMVVAAVGAYRWR